ncbi:redoxin domain-containing protein [bacterium]|nr:redoxin domain-containing protein [bacterium]
MMTQAQAASTEAAPHWSFESIYGGSYDSSEFKGKPILLVNTASLCGYTPQYTALQKLYDTYKDQGLVVFAVPSDDFHQEKKTNGEVKTFCELNYGITMPMATISKVTGPEAAPIYAWIKKTTGFAPRWNFNKVLFDRHGWVVGTWRSGDEPMGGSIEEAVRQTLSQA